MYYDSLFYKEKEIRDLHLEFIEAMLSKDSKIATIAYERTMTIYAKHIINGKLDLSPEYERGRFIAKKTLSKATSKGFNIEKFRNTHNQKILLIMSTIQAMKCLTDEVVVNHNELTEISYRSIYDHRDIQEKARVSGWDMNTEIKNIKKTLKSQETHISSNKYSDFNI